MRHPADASYRQHYTLHVMGGMVVALLLALAAVHAWPLPGDDQPDQRLFSSRAQETIQMEEIVPTRQARQTPPPPAPLPPVIVPNDVVLDEVEFDFTDSFLPIDDPGADRTLAEGDADVAPQATFARADSGPKAVRIVEPRYTREAERKKVRAEIIVEVLVDERGQVHDTKILERFLLDDDGPRTPVEEVGYGLEDAALAAAERWLFRPARENGKAVRSYHTLSFKFGI